MLGFQNLGKMLLMLIDSHAHLSSESLRLELPPILERAKQKGIIAIINIATSKEELEHAWTLSKEYPWIYPAAATTPHDVERLGELDFPFFAKAAREHRLIAIGETGLDYYYKHSPPDLQQAFFRRYLELALETDLPLIIHCRDAFRDLFSIADEMHALLGKSPKILLHCFTGSLDEAQEVIQRGWFLSLSGIVTFKNSMILKEVAKAVPEGRLLIETDAPYLAPIPYRGKSNEPAYITETAKCIATLREISLEELEQMTSNNAQKFFLSNLEDLARLHV